MLITRMNTTRKEQIMKKINIGIIGLGGIANKHIAELLSCEDAQIVAICDISPAAIKKKKRKAALTP